MGYFSINNQPSHVFEHLWAIQRDQLVQIAQEKQSEESGKRVGVAIVILWKVKGEDKWEEEGVCKERVDSA